VDSWQRHHFRSPVPACIPTVIARASHRLPVRMQFQRPVLVAVLGRFSPAPACDRGAVGQFGFAGRLAAGAVLWANAA